MEKKKAYDHWKQGQATRVNYRDDIHLCRDKICVAKTQLQLKLASTVADNKKYFLKYVNSKRRTKKKKKSTGLLLDEGGHFTKRNVDKAEMFNAFFTCLQH